MLAPLLVLTVALASAETPPRACGAPVYRQLDFWIGTWAVSVGSTVVGEDIVEKTLDGCAILEHWTDARGRRGESLFYVEPAGGGEPAAALRWKQVWVTGTGQVKEKTLVERRPDGSVRFEGFAITAGDRRADRTTLTPLADGRVRQVIEQSADGGKTWTVGFDAVYERKDAD